ncbi:hypothetical protein BDP81DRAFT_428842 [Colletotrichum phormii]|uniref:Uncharacterized protein n=1 Tax=Colletotrichum phormii TaxID=359342 RepID=A0AAI9ZPV5_9PEZI|nr:uncharacterized protein BDP81DRAFT_428842 [Colletotrichum phormii]KAK1635997.1 hypothetical protein BDP81DRAFT_428842 [Colletotrichum phormii]
MRCEERCRAPFSLESRSPWDSTPALLSDTVTGSSKPCRCGVIQANLMPAAYLRVFKEA